MRRIALIFFIFFINKAFSQQLPIDSITNKVSFSEVVSIENISKSELYNRAKQWIAITFKSASSVIQLDDKESGIIISKGFSIIYINNGIAGIISQKMYYTLYLHIKDGRYKYNFTDIYYGDSSENACEGIITDKVFMIKGVDKKTLNIWKQYRKETIVTLTELIDNLKKSMYKPIINNEW